MDFWQTVLVLVRRWYITLPAVLGTLGLAALAYSVVPLQYESDSALVLTAPLSGGTAQTQAEHPGADTNPLLNFEKGLGLTASIIIEQLNSAEEAAPLGVRAGGRISYQVNNGTTNPELLQSGPFIFIAGEGPSAEAAEDITARVAASAREILAERQYALKAPLSTHIGMQVIVAPTPGHPLRGDPLRAAAAAGALAAVAGLTAVYGVESWSVHRRRRQRSSGPLPRAAREALTR